MSTLLETISPIRTIEDTQLKDKRETRCVTVAERLRQLGFERPRSAREGKLTDLSLEFSNPSLCVWSPVWFPGYDSCLWGQTAWVQIPAPLLCICVFV